MTPKELAEHLKWAASLDGSVFSSAPPDTYTIDAIKNNLPMLLRALSALSGLESVKGASNIGWLVERNDLGAPRWLCFGPRHRDTTYTTDATKALRFVRKEDAEAAMYHLENNDPVLRVTEHVWLDQLEAAGG